LVQLAKGWEIKRRHFGDPKLKISHFWRFRGIRNKPHSIQANPKSKETPFLPFFHGKALPTRTPKFHFHSLIKG